MAMMMIMMMMTMMMMMMMMIIIIIIIIINRKFQGIKISSDKYFIRLSEIKCSTLTLYS